MLWKRLLERRVREDGLWRGLAERRGWIKHLFNNAVKIANVMTSDGSGSVPADHDFYRRLYPSVVADIASIEDNWRLLFNYQLVVAN